MTQWVILAKETDSGEANKQETDNSGGQEHVAEQGAIIREAPYFRYFAVYDSLHFFNFSGVPSKIT